MLLKAGPSGYREVIGGIRMKTPVYGRNRMMAEYRVCLNRGQNAVNIGLPSIGDASVVFVFRNPYC